MRSLKLLIFTLAFPMITNGQAQPGIINTIGGNGQSGYNGDGGSATAAQIRGPRRIRLDAAGNVYFIQKVDNVVRRISVSGDISTVAGSGSAGFSGDGGLATAATLNGPSDIAIDALGNIYISDSGNHRIRKIDAATSTITTICGTGQEQFSGDNGPAVTASLVSPKCIAVDKQGNLYIGGGDRVRKINGSTGIITTIMGHGYAGNTNGFQGPAVAADISTPWAMCADTTGNLYLAIPEHIVKVDVNGMMSRLAGSVTGGYTGTGGVAINALITTQDLAVDYEGRLFLSEVRGKIRMIDLQDTMRTIAGNPISPGGTNGSFAGDGGPALSSELNWCQGIAVDNCDNLYIADFGNNRVRKVTYATCNALAINSVSKSTNVICIFPNPITSTITITSDTQIKQVIVTDITGREVLRSGETTIDVNRLVSGVYFVRVRNVSGEVSVEKIIKE